MRTFTGIKILILTAVFLPVASFGEVVTLKCQMKTYANQPCHKAIAGMHDFCSYQVKLDLDKKKTFMNESKILKWDESEIVFEYKGGMSQKGYADFGSIQQMGTIQLDRVNGSIHRSQWYADSNGNRISDNEVKRREDDQLQRGAGPLAFFPVYTDSGTCEVFKKKF